MSNKNKDQEKIFILPDPLGDEIQYWELDQGFFSHFHPVVKTFVELTKQTCPHPNENLMYDQLMTDMGCSKDGYNNYYLIIPKADGSMPKTMFTSHLDTADSISKPVKHLAYSVTSKKTGEERYYIETDGSSILGADCKAGTALQFHMIKEGIPGLYYFFLGEEVGLKGSHWLAANFKQYDFLENIKHCVSFDRMRNHSIITKQAGNECCSDDFAETLIKEFEKQNFKMEKDPTGTCTDSLAFTHLISECTNLSVGYKGQHTKNEYQDITFLSGFITALLGIDWEKLPATRVPELRRQGKYANIPNTSNINTHYYPPKKGSSKNISPYYDDVETKMLTDLIEDIPYMETLDDLSSVFEEYPKEFFKLLIETLGLNVKEAMKKIFEKALSKLA